MTDKNSLWRMKNDGLIELCKKYEIGYDPDNLNRQEVINQIVAKEMEEGFLREAMESSTDEGGNIKPITAPRKKQKYIDVIFHEQEGMSKVVFLGHNGDFLYLPREYVCRIPYKFLSVLKDSVEVQLIQEKVGTKIRYRELKIPRYSYEILGQGEK